MCPNPRPSGLSGFLLSPRGKPGSPHGRTNDDKHDDKNPPRSRSAGAQFPGRHHSTGQPLLSLNTHNENWRDPEVSPAQPDGQPAQTTTTPIPDDRRSYHEELVATWKDELENASAAEILSWAAEKLDGPVAITLSMQDTILAELAQQAFDGQQADAELVFLDTGYHFPETLDTAAAVEDRYNLPLRRITPTLSRAEQDDVYGPNLYQRNPTACCRMRKVEPLARMLDPFEAWVSGVRRVDSPLRANTPVIEVDRTGRLKLNPIAAWTDEEDRKSVV